MAEADVQPGILTRAARALHHYGHAFEVRGLLLSEYLRDRRRGGATPPGLGWKIWRNPARYEDFLNLARFIEGGDSVLLVDIGGNAGDWAGDFRAFFPASDIVAFEPDPRAFAAYQRRFSTDAKVRVHNVALSNERRQATFRLAQNTVYSTLEEYAATQAERSILMSDECVVSVESLDSFGLDAQRYDTVVLKIDVQGHEVEALAGAVATLPGVDVVLAELSFAGEYEKKVPSFAPACKILCDAGLYPAIFQCYGRELGPYAFERDVVFARQERLDRIYGWA
ncbi:MAG: FkbM family methyltransferase [Planctomycetia bacterium]|nr:FkbM family methyltransferase [Planctomycetia bacterium]